MPYFLFTGVLISRIQDRLDSCRTQYPWIKPELMPYIGADEHLTDLVERRVLEYNQKPELACTTCKYRAPLGELSDHWAG